MIRYKKLLIALCALVVLAGVYFLYMAWAFPAERCEAAKHLDAPQMEGDCYTCHRKSTPRLAQEWYESKHGIIMVRCQTCHGMPDGKGAIPFARRPGVEVCARCHSLSMQRMEEKFGKRDDCSTCHPNHQSPMHGKAYEYRTPSDKKEL